MANKSKKIMQKLIYALCTLLLCFVACLNYVAFSFEGTITQALCGTGVEVDKEALAEATEEGTAVARQIAEEGIVMLKNDGVLPLENKKVNVFGASSSDSFFVYMGVGSGAGSANGRETLYAGLRSAGVEINETLAEKYNNLKLTRGDYNTGTHNGVRKTYDLYEPDASFYNQVKDNAKNFSDTALVVISRSGGEDGDWSQQYSYDKDGTQHSDRSYSELSSKEVEMITWCKENFSNVIVLLNLANPIECGFLDELGVNAALSCSLPGNHGTQAVGKILLGEVNPSGRTADTYAYDVTTAPTFINSGLEGGQTLSSGSSTYRQVVYAEGIYTGYYWYETADAEGFFASDYAKTKWNVSSYEEVVQFPFGYGLSYTTFDWEVIETSISEHSDLAKDSEITFKLYVENTGLVSGKDVIELYLTAPYTKGGIEKPAVKLVGTAKTGELAPGQGEEVSLTVSAYDLASYDYSDANNNNFAGYELEKGEYALSFRTDAHTVKEMKGIHKSGSYTYNVASDIKFEKDPVTGYIVENRFTNGTTASGITSVRSDKALTEGQKAYSSDGSDAGLNVTYLTRSNFTGTFPEKFTGSFNAELYNKSYKVGTPKNNSEDKAYDVNVSTTLTLSDFIYEKKDENGEIIYEPQLDSKGEPERDENGEIIYAPVYELIPFEDTRWDELVSSLSLGKLMELVGKGGFGTISIPQIGKSATSDKDGPSGFNSAMSSGSDKSYTTTFPCETLIAQTWNWKIAYQWGLAMGAEGRASGTDGWYGPGLCMHRDVLGGRNFEYYSEDAYLSGLMGAYTIKGAKENGVYAYVKHFAVNDDEWARTDKYTWLTEQAMREVYLKPFEMAVKVGGANGMMSAFNRIGSMRCGGDYALNTEVLRNEWGFRGTVITDYYQSGDVNDIDECIRAGVDLALFPNQVSFDDTTSNTTNKCLHESAKNILWTYMETRYTAMTAKTMDLSTVTAVRTEVYPWWIWIVVGLDVLAFAGCAFWAYSVSKEDIKKLLAKNK